jgi:hypothetical protein
MQAEADMSFMITTINKYILMQEEHEIGQQKFSATLLFESRKIIDDEQITQKLVELKAKK